MPNSSSNRFGERLAELRTKAGLSQAALGEAAGMTRGGVAQLEAGRRRPSWDSVQALCKALGVDCREFQEPPAAKRKR